MIEAAVILSAVDRHWPDFGIILVLLVANAVVGSREEHAAGSAIEAKLAVKARGIRDGKCVNPAVRDLVPDDAVFSGFIIRRGESGALVYGTDANTSFGKTAELVQDAHTVSHFQKVV